MKLNINQTLRPISQSDIDSLDGVILLLDTATKPQIQSSFPYCDIFSQRLKKRDQRRWGTSPSVVELPNGKGTLVVLCAIEPEISSFDLLTRMREVNAILSRQKPTRIGVYLAVDDHTLGSRLAEGMVAALGAANYALPSFKSKPALPWQPRQLTVFGLEKKFNFARTRATVTGNNLARRLTSMPPNYLTPGLYRKDVQKLARDYGWKMEFLDIPALKKKKAGAFLAVAQGSANADAGIVHLRYQPDIKSQKTARAPLALVGKGICFDTGGTNLKPVRSMHGMHEDMAGSAVALGTLAALTELQVKFPVDCWLALSENLIGPKAYKQNDVVRASNGTTIEIVHTDAEGRMVLADTLALASKRKPALIIDYATLTGSCISALSTRYSGALTNRMQLINDIIEAGQTSGERVWPFPQDADFDSALESTIADIKQCTLGGEADHILATRFLSHFVNDIPWIHIDLASANHKGGLAHVPGDITGFGVRFTVELLLEQKILGRV
jgi:leucyl aminopeptidase